MRDIRSDLQERATLIDDQLRAAVAHFDKTIRQLQTSALCSKADIDRVGDRPPLLDTLTGGRPPGRKVSDPHWGLGDNKRK
jgi:hypothetical protein